MKRHMFIIVAICILLAFLMFVLSFFFRTRVAVLNENPAYFLENFPIQTPMEFDVVKTEADAVGIAKMAIASVYEESAFRHSSYSVYFDEEKGQYFIVASGKMFHASAHVVVNKKDGSIAYIFHGKF